MRKVLLYILLLFCLPVCLSAQVAYMEEKAKVNKIKRSSLYLYGEGIAATVEEATAMAETSLKNAILSEMGENEKLQDSDQILINSIKKHSEKIQLKRGAMERVFLYVEKKHYSRPIRLLYWMFLLLQYHHRKSLRLKKRR